MCVNVTRRSSGLVQTTITKRMTTKYILTTYFPFVHLSVMDSLDTTKSCFKLFKITFIFDRCRCHLIAATLIKYAWLSLDNQCFDTPEKVGDRGTREIGSVTPTPAWVVCGWLVCAIACVVPSHSRNAYPVLKLGQFAMPESCENCLSLVDSCAYYDHQTCEICQVLSYSVGFKAPGEIWNPPSKAVLSKCGFIR